MITLKWIGYKKNYKKQHPELEFRLISKLISLASLIPNKLKNLS